MGWQRWANTNLDQPAGGVQRETCGERLQPINTENQMRKLKIIEHVSQESVLQHSPARSFELVSTQAFSSGIIFGTYKAAGPLKGTTP